MTAKLRAMEQTAECTAEQTVNHSYRSDDGTLTVRAGFTFRDELGFSVHRTPLLIRRYNEDLGHAKAVMQALRDNNKSLSIIGSYTITL